MSILDKAKQLTGEAQESAGKASDELLAKTIIIAGEKMEKTNVLLKAQGARYRVSSIEVNMSIPPSVSFCIRRIDKK
ncbi:hypothetical protein [Candidatus Spongiihabitans sp.]|uniref:hypothetical protein n=1 Tax=Candidatus Spongiihabitans sp. TaxID=3101308 RepID=UPI003C7C6B12